MKTKNLYIYICTTLLIFFKDGPNEKIQAVIDSGVCRRIVELLMSQQQVRKDDNLQLFTTTLQGNCKNFNLQRVREINLTKLVEGTRG